MNATIFVAGGLNLDLVFRVERFPAPGATVHALDYRTFCGGKGANQAVAASRLGGRVTMIGRIGDDEAGAGLVTSLLDNGVEVSHVQRTALFSTGVAQITVQDDGQNQIIVSSGANAYLTAADIEEGLAGAKPGDYLLLQYESPGAVIESAARLARLKGLTVIFDPAPAAPLSPALIDNVHIVTPNEIEAMTLIGRSDANISDEVIDDTAERVRALGFETAILKLGDRGAAVCDARGIRRQPAPRVEAIDTTAAGDTFNGALAVALAEGQSLDTAVQFAAVAAALSVTRAGAQSSMPTRAEVESARARLRPTAGTVPPDR